MNPIDTVIWDEPQLFVDSEIIECSQTVARRWHKPIRHEQPVLVKDKPWEEGLYFTYSNYTVLYDPLDGKTKCWYEDLGRLDGKEHPFHNSLLYAESDDGVHFEKPVQDVCAIDGRATNIVMGFARGGQPTPTNPWAKGGVHSNAIIIDPFAQNPDERFRTAYSDCQLGPGGEQRHVTSCAHSPDGIHWRAYPQNPSYGSAKYSLSDVSCLWYDHENRQFVQNTRHGQQYSACLPIDTPRTANRWFAPYYPNRADLMNKRRIWQTRSHDFLHWGEPLEIVTPNDVYDNLDEAYYGMPQFQVGRQHFGLLGVFHCVDNQMYVRLTHSRDGVNWRMTDNAKPFLSPRGADYWDAFMVSMTSPPIEKDGQWWFYHGGTNCHHDWWMSGAEALDAPEAQNPGDIAFCLGLAKLRKEGFASMYAGPMREGYLLTKPLRSCGSQLVINGACGEGGYIKAEITNIEGQVVGECSLDKCDTFSGDAVDHVMTWADISDVPEGGEWSRRRIRFVLRDAHLFSFSLV